MPAHSFWERTKSGSKTGFERLYGLVNKLEAPVNRLSNKLGSEAFWPTTLDKESDKAARILRSFCKDGFYEEETTGGPTNSQKQKVLKKIPPQVIRNAKGLAIFTTMRTGLWVSGAGGSGVLVGRLEDGTWSPPSGIMLHTAGLGFLIGVDIYDCVVVINSYEALAAFSKVRCTLGTEISAVAGPVGVGGILETELHKRQAPIFTYLKSRGFYAGVQIDGTIIIERTDENERFYNERISVGDILAGKARHPPLETRRLLETIKAAQGDTDVDESLLPMEPPPADYEITTGEESDQNTHLFGVPSKDDPDPFGVLALERAGLEIREAGTRARPPSEMFSFAPSPSSPIFPAFSRASIDARSISQWSSRPESQLSFDRPSIQMSDMATQTDLEEATEQAPASTRPRTPSLPVPEENDLHNSSTPPTARSSIAEAQSVRDTASTNTSLQSLKPSIEINGLAHLDDGDNEIVSPTIPTYVEKIAEEPETEEKKAEEKSTEEKIAEEKRAEEKEAGEKKAEEQKAEEEKAEEKRAEEQRAEAQRTGEKHDMEKNGEEKKAEEERAEEKNVHEHDAYDQDENDDDNDEVIEEPIVQQVFHTATAPQIISRPRLVTVNKPHPPRLPIRSPLRIRVSLPPSTKDEGTGIDDLVSERRLHSPPKTRHWHSMDSRISTTPSVDSVTSSIAKLRASSESPSKSLDNEAATARPQTPVI